MRFPLIGTLDMKSVVIGALFVYFVLPWLMGMFAGRSSNGGE